MRVDDLIDDVARRMTTVGGRPALRTRVAGAIEATPQIGRRTGFVPVTASLAAVAIATLVWFLLPVAPPAEDRPAVVAEGRPVAAPVQPAAQVRAAEETASSVPVAALARASRVSAGPAATAKVAPAPDTATSAWADDALVEIPMLPPLPGPSAIVIEPITWDDVTIAPLTVELIEVESLVVEPLAWPEQSGA